MKYLKFIIPSIAIIILAYFIFFGEREIARENAYLSDNQSWSCTTSLKESYRYFLPISNGKITTFVPTIRWKEVDSKSTFGSGINCSCPKFEKIAYNQREDFYTSFTLVFHNSKQNWSKTYLFTSDSWNDIKDLKVDSEYVLGLNDEGKVIHIYEK